MNKFRMSYALDQANSKAFVDWTERKLHDLLSDVPTDALLVPLLPLVFLLFVSLDLKLHKNSRNYLFFIGA